MQRMETVSTAVLRSLVAASAEPQLLLRIDSPDWPVVYSNPAFKALSGTGKEDGMAFPDVLQPMIGAERTRDASRALRNREAVKIPVDISSREFLLVLVPVPPDGNESIRYYAAYLRTAGHLQSELTGTGSLRGLARTRRPSPDSQAEDPATGLMSEGAFRRLFEHDWSVAARESAALGLLAFSISDYDAYLDVFGKHGADSCLRRISDIVGRSLKRASDIAARVSGPQGGWIVALCHGAEEPGLFEFAERISRQIRELGLHHPRSQGEKFVTVNWQVEVILPAESGGTSQDALGRLLSVGAGAAGPRIAAGGAG